MQWVLFLSYHKPQITELPYIDPIEAFENIKKAPTPLLLHSSSNILNLGRYSFLAFDPFLTFKFQKGRIEIEDKNSLYKSHDNPFKILKEIFKEYKINPNSPFPFASGAIGYLGYDLGRYLEILPKIAIEDIKLPEIFLCFFINCTKKGIK